MCILLKLHYAKFDVSRLLCSKVIEEKPLGVGSTPLGKGRVKFILSMFQESWKYMPYVGVCHSVNVESLISVFRCTCTADYLGSLKNLVRLFGDLGKCLDLSTPIITVKRVPPVEAKYVDLDISWY